MEYLKLFNTESEYTAYRDGKDYLKPNVSLSDGNSTVYYNYPPPPDFNGHDYVDLGLPSGTLWATMNVGASKASEAGLYFQWGDTKGYTAEQVGTGDGQKKFGSDGSDYKWFSGGTLIKYATTGATLELEDDAAHANMGGSWHTPTLEQCMELIDNTTSSWTTVYGVNGGLFTSKTDTSKSIFIPAAGEVYDGFIEDIGELGCFWVSILSDTFVGCGNCLGTTSYRTTVTDRDASIASGRSVRGVIDKKQQ